MMTLPPHAAELCQPPSLAKPGSIVAAMTDDQARGYLRIMIMAEPRRFEGFLRLDCEDPIGRR